MAESFSRQKSRHAPQKEGGLKILCDLPPRQGGRVGKSISPKIPLLLFFFSNVSLVLLLAKVCKPTRCSSTGYQYSELLFFSCLFSGQLKLHNGVLGAGIIDYIPATFTNSDTPSTNNAFLLKATFCYSSRILALFSTLLSY